MAFCEINPRLRRVLLRHHPGVPVYEDLQNLPPSALAVLAEADVLVAGTPCQAFSLAGLRMGLDDERGNLTRTFVEVANAADSLRRAAGLPPQWALWENVPGVLSDRTNAFGTLLAGLVGGDSALGLPAGRGRWPDAGVVSGPLGGAAWRVLDAQYFGLAQRRKRVFVLARGGPGAATECADALLPVAKSMCWHPPPRRVSREETAPGATSGLGSNGIAYGGGNPEPLEVATTLTAGGRLDFESETFIVIGSLVRRLTPTECERLQGFPPGYTDIPDERGGPMPDSMRYRALGNSMPVPVVRWIGERIMAADPKGRG